MFWVLCSLYKHWELNSCHEEGNKNFTVTSNKPNFHSNMRGLQTNTYFTQIFQLTAVKESQIANERKLFPWTLCGIGLAGNIQVLFHF